MLVLVHWQHTHTLSTVAACSLKKNIKTTLLFKWIEGKKSLKCLYRGVWMYPQPLKWQRRHLMVKWTYSSQVDIPAASMPVAHTPKPWNICGTDEMKLHILVRPHLFRTGPRQTWAESILSNQHLEMPHRSDEWIVLAKRCSLTWILRKLLREMNLFRALKTLKCLISVHKVLPLYWTQSALSYGTLTHVSQAQDNMCWCSLFNRAYTAQLSCNCDVHLRMSVTYTMHCSFIVHNDTAENQCLQHLCFITARLVRSDQMLNIMPRIYRFGDMSFWAQVAWV